MEVQKKSQRRFEILSYVLAETDSAKLEIATNYVIFGEDIVIVTCNDSVEAFLGKETDSLPIYPNGLTSSNEIPPIVETLLESSPSSIAKDHLFVADLTSAEMPSASKRMRHT